MIMTEEEEKVYWDEIDLQIDIARDLKIMEDEENGK